MTSQSGPNYLWLVTSGYQSTKPTTMSRLNSKPDLDLQNQDWVPACVLPAYSLAVRWSVFQGRGEDRRLARARAELVTSLSPCRFHSPREQMVTRVLNKKGICRVCVSGMCPIGTSSTPAISSEPKIYSHLQYSHPYNKRHSTKSVRLRHISASNMDFVKNLAGGNKEGEQQQGQQQQGEQKSEGGFMSKLNNMAGGGAAGEKKEDGLDKGEQACPHFRTT